MHNPLIIEAFKAEHAANAASHEAAANYHSTAAFRANTKGNSDLEDAHMSASNAHRAAEEAYKVKAGLFSPSGRSRMSADAQKSSHSAHEIMLGQKG